MADYYVAPKESFDATANAIRSSTASDAEIEWGQNGFADSIDTIVEDNAFISGSKPAIHLVANTITAVKEYRCYARTGIKSLSSTSITQIREFAFAWCSNLEEVNLPNLKYIRNGDSGTNYNSQVQTFRSCKIKKVIFPSLEQIYGVGCFMQNTYQGGIFVLPSLKSSVLPTQTFYNAAKGTIVDIGGNYVSTINGDCFYNGNYSSAQADLTLILRKTDGIVASSTSDAIRFIKRIYVPSALVETYKTATNWVTRYTNGHMEILPIEGSAYEGVYADGTLIASS